MQGFLLDAILLRNGPRVLCALTSETGRRSEGNGAKIAVFQSPSVEVRYASEISDISQSGMY